MTEVVTSILAGGQGTRLYPLTKMRSKPAVPIAGRFRLIDFPISNAIHSGLRRIFILSQFSTESLHRHIFQSYRFDIFSKDFITVLSAQQTLESRNWYQGTADAVRQNLRFFKTKGELILILSGDHLYRMDFRRFIDFHLAQKADISVSVYPVKRDQAPSFGVMKVDQDCRIEEFFEKPQSDEDLDRMASSPQVCQNAASPDGDSTHLASMGIYLFNRDVLIDLLDKTDFEDFGRDVIPFAIHTTRACGYFFDGYWEDIGTIRSFFDAHINLTHPLPKFNLYDEKKPIFTNARFLPGSKILASDVQSSILCEGSIIDRSEIRQSIIGIRSRIGEGSRLDHTILMGADFFEAEEDIRAKLEKDIPAVGVGRGCEIRNAIIDKNARIGHDVRIVNARSQKEAETDVYSIRDGITIIPKNAVIPDGTEI